MPSDRVTPPFFWTFPPGSSVLPAASGSTPAAEAEGRDSGNVIPRAYLSVTGAARALPGNFPENLFCTARGHMAIPRCLKWDMGGGWGLGMILQLACPHRLSQDLRKHVYLWNKSKPEDSIDALWFKEQ